MHWSSRACCRMHRYSQSGYSLIRQSSVWRCYESNECGIQGELKWFWTRSRSNLQDTHFRVTLRASRRLSWNNCCLSIPVNSSPISNVYRNVCHDTTRCVKRCCLQWTVQSLDVKYIIEHYSSKDVLRNVHRETFRKGSTTSYNHGSIVYDNLAGRWSYG